VLVKVCVAVTLLATPAVGVAQTATAQAPPPAGQYEPKVGQAGKDVVWVPSPESTVEKMLDVAKVTPQDFVVDLGSGDGRNVIAAAKRGAKALGVEYNPDMVELSKRNAAAAGVSDKASFVRATARAEFSQATVLALFSCPTTCSSCATSSRRSSPDAHRRQHVQHRNWTADETVTIDGDCRAGAVLLYVVPAESRDLADAGDLALKQQFQPSAGRGTTASRTAA
jgi:SAM-dependent methyltransferase